MTPKQRFDAVAGILSLHAQREATEAYIASQRNEAWTDLPKGYSDGGFTGGEA